MGSRGKTRIPGHEHYFSQWCGYGPTHAVLEQSLRDLHSLQLSYALLAES